MSESFAVTANTAPGLASEPVPAQWHPLTRLAFRFAFCYFLLYATCCGNATLWEVIPFHIGERIEDGCNWPFRHAAEWLGQHLFHLTGVGARLHDSGSGDRALDWIAVGIMLSLALLATLLWTLAAEARRPRKLAYPRLFAWFRLALRLTLAVALLGYGLAKLFPLQMGPPSLAVLNEPFGNTSPMMLLWTLIGLNPVYEMICGAAEILAGLLILFRRTALLGALITAFVVTNVVLYNYFFDVPVKLYATHLLLMSLVLILPDTPALFAFFWQHRPVALSLPWSPFNSRRSRLIETVVVVVILLLAVLPQAFDMNASITHQHAGVAHPGTLTGQWHLESATFRGNPKPYLTGDGLPLTDLFFEPSGRLMGRAADNALWRGGSDLDEKKHTLGLFLNGHGHVDYALTQPDPQHLVLTPIKDDAKTESTLTLTRVPLPAHYPLLDRGFHLVNEWGLER